MASKIIHLEITDPAVAPVPGPIEGFRFFWAFYVKGYRPERHCQPCFRGKLVKEVCTATVRSGVEYRLDAIERYGYVYVCGVGTGPKAQLKDKNFHLPLRFREGGTVTATTWNGYTVTARNAEAVPIPALPEGWQGLSREHTRCKNFQFAVAQFGYPPAEA
jgi:hypothetical protein